MTHLTIHEVPVAGRTLQIAAPADPDAMVLAGQQSGEPSPGYWANLWPSSLLLASVVAESPLLGPGVRILEIGCGLGLVGLAAALRGADVLMTDFNPLAVEAARANAQRNALAVRAERFDWNSPPPQDWAFDLLLASDVLYEPASAAPVARLIARLGCPALIADPPRPRTWSPEEVFRDSGLSVWSTPSVGGRVLMVG